MNRVAVADLVAQRGWMCVGEDGIEDDQVDRELFSAGMTVATAGTIVAVLQLSNDDVEAFDTDRQECRRNGPPMTSRPGDGMELKEPR